MSARKVLLVSVMNAPARILGVRTSASARETSFILRNKMLALVRTFFHHKPCASTVSIITELSNEPT